MSGELVIIAGRDPLRHAGGAESYAVALARLGCRLGLHPHLFTVARRGERRETPFGTLHRVASPARPVRSLYSVLQHPFLVRAIVRFLSGRPGPHVIHSFCCWSDIGRAASRRLARAGVHASALTTSFTTIGHENAGKLTSGAVRDSAPLWVLSRAELGWARQVAARAERRGYRGSRLVLVNYESVRALVQEAYGPGLPELRRLTYCAPSAFADGPPVPERPAGLDRLGDAPLIVSVSRHSGRKAVDVLIRALAGLRDAGVAFRACLVGGGILLEAHRRLVRSLCLHDRVALPGQVPDVGPYLHGADVYVLPSAEEGSGSVSVLEALQAGVAIVSTNVDGLPEDLTHERDALLVPARDAVALRDALARLLADPWLRARLGRAGRATFERRFTAERAAAELGAVYRELGLAVRLP